MYTLAASSARFELAFGEAEASTFHVGSSVQTSKLLAPAPGLVTSQ
jgi:hypothetical protein